MNELTDFNDPTPDLTLDERNLLRRAGASEELIEMCQVEVTDLKRSDGKTVNRNSTLEEVKKYIREWEDLDLENATEFSHYGGGFFSKIWEGNIYAAYGSADSNNRAIMLEAFGIVRINQDRPNGQNPVSV